MLPNEMTSPQSFSLPRADWASSVDDSVVYKALLNRVAVPIVRAFVGVFWFCIEAYGFASVMPHCRRETSALKVMQERAAVEARTAAREAAKPAGEKEEKEKKPAKQLANPMQRPEEDVAVEHNKVLAALVSCVYHSNYPPATLPHHHFGKPENRASTVDYLKSVASFAEYQTIGTLFPLSPQNYNSVHAKTYSFAPPHNNVSQPVYGAETMVMLVNDYTHAAASSIIWERADVLEEEVNAVKGLGDVTEDTADSVIVSRTTETAQKFDALERKVSELSLDAAHLIATRRLLVSAAQQRIYNRIAQGGWRLNAITTLVLTTGALHMLCTNFAWHSIAMTSGFLGGAAAGRQCNRYESVLWASYLSPPVWRDCKHERGYTDLFAPMFLQKKADWNGTWGEEEGALMCLQGQPVTREDAIENGMHAYWDTGILTDPGRTVPDFPMTMHAQGDLLRGSKGLADQIAAAKGNEDLEEWELCKASPEIVGGKAGVHKDLQYFVKGGACR
ncbi:hypothetical protein TeGR_g2587, partial [Tetraparma gracilis]